MAGHILLLPFVGIIPAPFMVVTWVSDQHLYPIIPAFLCFWIFVFEKIKLRHNWIFLLLLASFFSYKTYESSHYYKSEITFYEESLRSNPTNLPIVYNLAVAHIFNGDRRKSFELLEKTYFLSQHLPELKRRRFYNYIILLYNTLKYSDEKTNP